MLTALTQFINNSHKVESQFMLMMRNLLTVALILSAYCEAGTLRRNADGFEVVGGGSIHESVEVEEPRRELIQEEDLVGDEIVEDLTDGSGAVKEYINDDRDYVSNRDRFMIEYKFSYINPKRIRYCRLIQKQAAVINPHHAHPHNSHFNLPSQPMAMATRLPTN